MKIVANKKDIPSRLSELEEGKLYQITEFKEPRTRKQNGTYWELLGQYADYFRLNREDTHLEMLKRYGQKSYFECDLEMFDKVRQGFKDVEEININENSGKVNFLGVIGTEFYNTKEMSILIDGLISEIRQSEAPIQLDRECDQWKP